MNESGCITIGFTGGPCVCIGFDIADGKSLSVITYFKTSADAEYMAAENVLSQVVKGRIPGSHRTMRLRKKRRKAVLAALPILESMGLIRAKFSLPVTRSKEDEERCAVIIADGEVVGASKALDKDGSSDTDEDSSDE